MTYVEDLAYVVFSWNQFLEHQMADLFNYFIFKNYNNMVKICQINLK